MGGMTSRDAPARYLPPIFAGLAALAIALAAVALATPAHGLTTGELVFVDTAITGGPGEGTTIEDTQPVFTFSASVNPPSTSPPAYYCSVDNAAPAPCASPRQLTPLNDGQHSFSVFAEDPASGFADTTPDSRKFIVDTSEPEEAEEECFEEDEEAEEAGECEEEDASPFPPEDCLLRTARARVFTYVGHDKVRLVIRYTSLALAEVAVEYRLKGSKGSLQLGEVKQRFGKRGLFRTTESLSEPQMAKVRAAKGFAVQLRIPAAPSFCNHYYDRHLTIKRTVHSQVVWFQSDSVFGTDR